MDTTKRVLIIRTKSIGDIVFTIPAVNVIRAGFPDADITFLTSCEFEPLVDAFEGIDRVLGMDRHSLRSVHFARGIAATWQLLREVRSGGFDLVVDFQNYGETAALAWLSRASRRVGFASRRLRSRAFTSPARRWGTAHPIDENVRLLREARLPHVEDPPNFYAVPEPHMEKARAFLRAHDVDPSGQILFVQPLTSQTWKNWPLERYLPVVRHFRAEGVSVLVGGGPADTERLGLLRDEGFPVTTEESLMTDAGLMQLSTIVLGGDTGLIHLAVAMRRRVVALMWSKAPDQPIPYLRPEWVITPASGGRLDSIGEREVSEHVAGALGARHDS